MKQYHRKALLVAITLIINMWELTDYIESNENLPIHDQRDLKYSIILLYAFKIQIF